MAERRSRRSSAAPRCRRHGDGHVEQRWDWTEESFPGRAKRSAPKNRRGARIPVKNTARAATTGSKTPWGHTGHTGHKVQTMRAVSGQVTSGVYQYVELGTQAYRACSAPQGAIKVKGPKPSLFICRLGALGNLRLSATASSLLLGLGYRLLFTHCLYAVDSLQTALSRLQLNHVNTGLAATPALRCT